MNNVNDLLTTLDKHPDGATVETLAKAIGRNHSQVLGSCAVLYRRGLIDRPSIGFYRLTDDGKHALTTLATIHPGPMSGASLYRPITLRSRLWQALRQTKRATVQDLLKIAKLEDDDAHNALKNAQKYLRLLERGGFVMRLSRQAGTAPGSNGYIRWNLIRNTGPKAPSVYLKANKIFDHNTRTTYLLQPVEIQYEA